MVCVVKLLEKHWKEGLIASTRRGAKSAGGMGKGVYERGNSCHKQEV